MPQTNSRENEFIQRLTEITEANLANEQFGVPDLAREAGMSRSNLHRRVKSTTGLSVSQFIRKIRLEKAHGLLQNSSAPISEIAYNCGFHSVSYFNKCFHDHYGHPPGYVRNNNESVSDQNDQDPDKNQETERKKRTLAVAVIAFIAVVVITGIVLIAIKPFGARGTQLEKSIAVLPFVNDSPDEDKMYFIKSIREEIIDNLYKIEDLRIVHGNTVEQYKESPKPESVIARELGVTYLLSGSGVKEEEYLRLRVELRVPSSDRSIWRKKYDREAVELLTLSGEIAQAVAGEISAIITPEEKERIERQSTASPKAWEYYRQGKESYDHWEAIQSDWESHFEGSPLEQAEILYRKALEIDSAFAEVYIALAQLHFSKLQAGFIGKGRYSDRLETLDSCIKLADKALSIDPQYGEAYSLKGYYLIVNEPGTVEQAVEVLKKGTEYAPNYWETYITLGGAYHELGMGALALSSFYQAIRVYHGDHLEYIYSNIAELLGLFGLYEQSLEYCQKCLSLNHDTLNHLKDITHLSYITRHFEECVRYAEEGYSSYSDDDSYFNFHLAMGNMFLGRFEESLPHFEQQKNFYEETNAWPYWWHIHMHRMAYVLWNLGFEERANNLFDERVRVAESFHPINERWWQAHLYDLAAVQAFRGEGDEALRNLKFLHRKKTNWWILFPVDPMFDNLRDDPEFMQIINEIETDQEQERQKIMNWMEEEGLLEENIPA